MKLIVVACLLFLMISTTAKPQGTFPNVHLDYPVSLVTKVTPERIILATKEAHTIQIRSIDRNLQSVKEIAQIEADTTETILAPNQCHAIDIVNQNIVVYWGYGINVTQPLYKMFKTTISQQGYTNTILLKELYPLKTRSTVIPRDDQFLFFSYNSDSLKWEFFNKKGITINKSIKSKGDLGAKTFYFQPYSFGDHHFVSTFEEILVLNANFSLIDSILPPLLPDTTDRFGFNLFGLPSSVYQFGSSLILSHVLSYSKPTPSGEEVRIFSYQTYDSETGDTTKLYDEISFRHANNVPEYQKLHVNYKNKQFFECRVFNSDRTSGTYPPKSTLDRHIIVHAFDRNLNYKFTKSYFDEVDSITYYPLELTRLPDGNLLISSFYYNYAEQDFDEFGRLHFMKIDTNGQVLSTHVSETQVAYQPPLEVRTLGRDRYQLVSPLPGRVRWQLYDLHGQPVRDGQFHHQTQLQTEALSSGMYVLRAGRAGRALPPRKLLVR